MAFRWKFWKKNEVATRETIIPWRADSFNNHLFGLGYDPRVLSRQQALQYTPFARSVHLISTQAANVITNTLRVVNDRTGKPVSTRHADHVLSMLRESPDGMESAMEWVRNLFEDYLVYGNVLIWAPPSMAGGKRSLVRMNVRSASADIVDPNRGPSTLVYEMQPFGWTREPSLYHRSDVIHARFVSPDISYTSHNQTWMADWPLVYLSPTIRTGLMADAWVKDFFDSAAKNNMVIKFPNDMGEEQQLEVLEYFGISQTDKRQPLVASGGADVKTINPTPQDADALNLRRHQIEEIGRFYGVPVPLLGLHTTQWGSGIEELSRLLWRAGTKLAVETLLDKLSMALLPRGQKFKVNISEEIRGNMKTLVSVLQATKPTTNSPALITRAEARDLLGFYDDFEDDFGDWAKNIGKNVQPNESEDDDDEPDMGDVDSDDDDDMMDNDSEESRDD